MRRPANSNYGRRDKRFRTTHRLDTLNGPVGANHGVQPHCALNPLLFGFDWVRR
jgi:hypothetical protein